MSSQKSSPNSTAEENYSASPQDFLIAIIVAPAAVFILIMSLLFIDKIISPGSFTHLKIKTSEFNYVVRVRRISTLSLDGFVSRDDLDACLEGVFEPNKGSQIFYLTRDGAPRIRIEPSSAASYSGMIIDLNDQISELEDVTFVWSAKCAEQARRTDLSALIFGPSEFGGGLQTLWGMASIGTVEGLVNIYGRSTPLPGLGIEQELYSVFPDGFQLPPGAIVSAEATSPLAGGGIVSEGRSDLDCSLSEESEKAPDDKCRPQWRGFASFNFKTQRYEVTAETGAKTIYINHIIPDEPEDKDQISITPISRVLHDPTLQLIFPLASAILTPMLFAAIWFRRTRSTFKALSQRIEFLSRIAKRLKATK